MDARLERIGRLLAVARGLEREGAYNGSKLVRLALGRELVHYAEAEASSGGAAVAADVDALIGAHGKDLPADLADLIGRLAGTVRAGGTTSLTEAPRARLCRSCGHHVLGEDLPPACPSCGAPAMAFREEYPVWFLEPAEPAAILADLQAGADGVTSAVRGRSDAALALAPAVGEWSARQTLEHLLFAEELLATRIDRLLSEDAPDLAARAVWAETPPSDEGSAVTGQAASQLAARWLALRAATVERLAALPEAAWQRAGQHPEWGRVTVLSQAGYFARHTASHIAQLAAAASGALPRGR